MKFENIEQLKECDDGYIIYLWNNFCDIRHDLLLSRIDRIKVYKFDNKFCKPDNISNEIVVFDKLTDKDSPVDFEKLFYWINKYG